MGLKWAANSHGMAKYSVCDEVKCRKNKCTLNRDSMKNACPCNEVHLYPEHKLKHPL